MFGELFPRRVRFSRTKNGDVISQSYCLAVTLGWLPETVAELMWMSTDWVFVPNNRIGYLQDLRYQHQNYKHYINDKLFWMIFDNGLVIKRVPHKDYRKAKDLKVGEFMCLPDYFCMPLADNGSLKPPITFDVIRKNFAMTVYDNEFWIARIYED